jgi:hypothetical protein
VDSDIRPPVLRKVEKCVARHVKSVSLYLKLRVLLSAEFWTSEKRSDSRRFIGTVAVS